MERNFLYSWLPSRAPPRRLQPGIESAFIQKTLPGGPRNPALDFAFPLGVGVRGPYVNWWLLFLIEKCPHPQKKKKKKKKAGRGRETIIHVDIEMKFEGSKSTAGQDGRAV